jgi:hypothetical protein
MVMMFNDNGYVSAVPHRTILRLGVSSGRTKALCSVPSTSKWKKKTHYVLKLFSTVLCFDFFRCIDEYH